MMNKPGVGGSIFKLKLEKDWFPENNNMPLGMIKEMFKGVFYANYHPRRIRLYTGLAGMRLFKSWKKTYDMYHRLKRHCGKRKRRKHHLKNGPLPKDV